MVEEFVAAVMERRSPASVRMLLGLERRLSCTASDSPVVRASEIWARKSLDCEAMLYAAEERAYADKANNQKNDYACNDGLDAQYGAIGKRRVYRRLAAGNNANRRGAFKVASRARSGMT